MKSCNYSLPATSTATPHPSPRWLERQIIRRLANMLNQAQGTLVLTMPSGKELRFGDPQGATVEVHIHSLRAFLRLFTGSANGWSEAYLAGEWDSPDITALVRWALRNESLLERMAGAGFVTRRLHTLYHRLRRNSRSGSRRNIAAHYDLGNDFYELWLDPGMTYSSALFAQPEQTLEQAQHNKYRQILELLGAQKDDLIAEIGCGWGGFAEQAARDQGLCVEGITLSKEQLKWSQERIRRSGLAHKAQFHLTDYRDFEGSYDGLVSIEMFEAVGEEYWDSYFEMLKRCLKPGKPAVLQIISIEDARFDYYRKNADFIQRYVFPGGMLPSIGRLQAKFEQHGFVLTDKLLFGADYARTLRHWRARFEQQADALTALGYDERFMRLWRYYLCYCEGGFEEGSIDVGLYRIVKQEG